MSASFAILTLIKIAERRSGVDASRCRLALLHLETARFLQRSLRGALACYRLTDLQFAVLVILFSTEPEPISASVLADHAAFSRAAMTDALDQLTARELVTRTRDDVDRRMVYVRIAPKGQTMVDEAINDYLRTAEEATRDVEPAAQRALVAANVDLLRRLTSRAEPLRHVRHAS